MSKEKRQQHGGGLGKALVDLVMSGHTLADTFGHMDEPPEKVHQLAHTYYTQAKYETAMRLYAYLMTTNHLDRRYFSGFASCLRKLGRNEEALKYYGFASMLDLTDPEPVMRSAQCYIALRNIPKARMSLDYALMQAETHEAHKKFIPRLEGLLALIGSEPESATSAK